MKQKNDVHDARVYCARYSTLSDRDTAFMAFLAGRAPRSIPEGSSVALLVLVGVVVTVVTVVAAAWWVWGAG